MENYYEFLGIDMTASQEDISSVIEEKSLQENVDQEKLREIRSILLSETAKKIYDGKLVDHIINKGNKSVAVNISNAKTLLDIDNSVLHDKYVWIATTLFIMGILSGFIFGIAVNYTINMIVMIGLVVLFYMDWKLLEKHGKANFSKWWVLFSPVYVAKRCKALGKGKKLIFIWLGIWIAYGIGSFVFNSGTAMIEHSACSVVTDIYQKQLHQYTESCKNVTITHSEGKEHYGFAELSDGSTRDISVNETSRGEIYVQLE
jgi:hypothetical protein